MSNTMIPIPGRLHDVSTEGVVSGANEIYDDTLGKRQSELNGGILIEKDSTNGMGRKVLKPNLSFESQVTEPNTIYVIQHDFTLASDVTIPVNCILEFDGGSISGNGTNKDTITGTNTKIKAADVIIFNNGIVIAGTWICPSITSDWFGDILSENRIKQLVNLSNASINNTIIVKDGIYNCSISSNGESVIILNSNTNLILDGVIKLISNPFGSYQIIDIRNCYKVALNGKGKIIGDKDSHSSSSGEWGHGVVVMDSYNILISGIEVNKCWGDSVWFQNVDNIKIYDCKIDGSGRSGINWTYGKNITIDGNHVSNIVDKFTYTGISCEPNNDNEITENVIVQNNIITDCKWGIGFAFNNNETIRNLIIQNNKVIANLSEPNNNLTIGITVVGINNTDIKNVKVTENYVHGCITPFAFERVNDGILENNSFDFDADITTCIGSPNYENTIITSNNLYTSVCPIIKHCNNIRVSNNNIKMPLGIKIQYSNGVSIVNNKIDCENLTYIYNGKYIAIYNNSEKNEAVTIDSNIINGQCLINAIIRNNVFSLGVEQSLYILGSLSNKEIVGNTFLMKNRYVYSINIYDKFNIIDGNTFIYDIEEGITPQWACINLDGTSSYNKVTSRNEFSSNITDKVTNTGTNNTVEV